MPGINLCPHCGGQLTMPRLDTPVIWVVIKVMSTPRECGHRQSNLIAVCIPEGPLSAEDVALRFCMDDTYMIGPFPANSLVSDAPVLDWPGSYYPHRKRREETDP